MINLLTVDHKGKKIYLSKERWKHITKEHPDITSLEKIKETVKNPTIIKSSKYDKKVKWYYKYQKELSLYLFVAVKFLNGKGFIITAYYVRNIK